MIKKVKLHKCSERGAFATYYSEKVIIAERKSIALEIDMRTQQLMESLNVSVLAQDTISTPLFKLRQLAKELKK